MEQLISDQCGFLSTGKQYIIFGSIIAYFPPLVEKTNPQTINITFV